MRFKLKTIPLIILACGIFSAPELTNAETAKIDTPTKLFEIGNWGVTFGRYQLHESLPDYLSCSLSNYNGRGDSFDIIYSSFNGGGFQFFIWMAEWEEWEHDRGTRTVDLVLDLDDQRWIMEKSEFQGNSFWFDFEDSVSLDRFFKDMIKSSDLKLKNAQGDLTESIWFLRDASGAIVKFSECVKQVQNNQIPKAETNNAGY
jgi:hypothetical protein